MPKQNMSSHLSEQDYHVDQICIKLNSLNWTPLICLISLINFCELTKCQEMPDFTKSL